nr:MAG TPA_asm: hypothetical protein [Caudoviricetes sp.]
MVALHVSRDATCHDYNVTPGGALPLFLISVIAITHWHEGAGAFLMFRVA